MKLKYLTSILLAAAFFTNCKAIQQSADSDSGPGLKDVVGKHFLVGAAVSVRQVAGMQRFKR